VVSFTVGNGGPEVTITSPRTGASYGAPASVQLTATASDADGAIKKVEFYNGKTLLATQYSTPYSWTWEDVAAGTYKITAVATDNDGITTTSNVVSFTVANSTLSAASISGAPQLEEVSATTGASVKLSDFAIFPNPVVDKLFVTFNGAKNNQKATIIIRNLSGMLLKNIPVTLSGNGISVDVSSFNTGMYTLTVKGEDFSISKKFLKTH
jgi:hypothetical protein